MVGRQHRQELVLACEVQLPGRDLVAFGDGVGISKGCVDGRLVDGLVFRRLLRRLGRSSHKVGQDRLKGRQQSREE